MEKNMVFMLLLSSAMVPVTQGAIPGTFFWKPRMAIDLSIPTPAKETGVRAGGVVVNRETIREGLVVLVDGYEIGLTFVCFASGLSSAMIYPHLNPLNSHFYTDVYRWVLRYISVLPHWLKGSGGNIVDTTKLWRRRFYHLHTLTPKWLRFLLVYVPKSQWDEEDKEMVLFKKHSLLAFGKDLRYPNKHFNNFKSFETVETIESESSMSST